MTSDSFTTLTACNDKKNTQISLETYLQEMEMERIEYQEMPKDSALDYSSA
ncbi:hypothetical protein DPMN_032624 [Dreissena polymorpha]|uniref:Uncharacterized protein n=1 Tax=Dreissena polymorpha TaxID=45954 RepID=A0A9D4M442_DREPO|nr:hypothetical protein DPMN_032624 [Dreissena polymorpha]